MRRVAYLVVGGSSLAFAAFQVDRHRSKINLQASVLANNACAHGQWNDNWDRRHHTYCKAKKSEELGEGEKVEQKSKATRHLLLIRHGQYHLNVATAIERKLTTLGREQADLTGQRIKHLGMPVNRIIISTMTRAQETGGIISKYFPDVTPENCSLIEEGGPIAPIPPIHNWKTEAEYHEEGARIEAGFRKYFHRADPKQTKPSFELMVCHANVIRYYVFRALQLPPEAWLRLSLHNGSITWISIAPNGRVALRFLGECGFMDRDKLTTG